MQYLKGSFLIGYFAIGIVMLWFIGGFLMPYFFPNLQSSGAFGDGFGAINSLFSGLGLLAVAYTIYLQIEDKIERRTKDEFDFYIKQLDSIKNDLDSIHIGEFKGINFINLLESEIRNNFIRIRDYTSSFRQLGQLIIQFDYLTQAIREESILTESQKSFLRSKIYLLYHVYFNNIGLTIQKTETSNKSLLFLKELIEQAEVEMSLLYKDTVEDDDSQMD